MNELAAAQQQDQPNLEAVCSLVQQKGFSLAKSTEGIVHLVRPPTRSTRGYNKTDDCATECSLNIV